MTKPINDYTSDELSAKIEAIKAERERTANALKRYEDELERRKQEAPLGVPLKLKEGIEKGFYLQATLIVSEGSIGVDSILDKTFGVFNSKESAEKHAEMLLAWRKALVANAKGEPIDIAVLLPLLKKGWVAMDKTGFWYWHKNKPSKREEDWRAKDDIAGDMVAFNLKPAENWEESLMECGI